jgi:hypothetical protein
MTTEAKEVLAKLVEKQELLKAQKMSVFQSEKQLSKEIQDFVKLHLKMDGEFHMLDLIKAAAGND